MPFFSLSLTLDGLKDHCSPHLCCCCVVTTASPFLFCLFFFFFFCQPTDQWPELLPGTVLHFVSEPMMRLCLAFHIGSWQQQKASEFVHFASGLQSNDALSGPYYGNVPRVWGGKTGLAKEFDHRGQGTLLLISHFSPHTHTQRTVSQWLSALWLPQTPECWQPKPHFGSKD